MIFKETLTFHNKQIFENILKVQVYDKNTFINNLLGEYDVKLYLLVLDKDAVSEVACLASRHQCRLYVYCMQDCDAVRG